MSREPSNGPTLDARDTWGVYDSDDANSAHFIGLGPSPETASLKGCTANGKSKFKCTPWPSYYDSLMCVPQPTLTP